MDKYIFFSEAQGNLLIRLILAHLISDFVVQTAKMSENKNWLSRYMFAHIILVYGCSVLFTGWWMWSAVIALTHYIIDGLKTEARQRNIANNISLFVTDQLLHILVLIAIWAWHFSIRQHLLAAVTLPFTDYTISLILLGYLIVAAPVGYLIAFTTKGMMREDPDTASNERGGKNIGIYERIIILTFVLLGQYEAIGFLITGKSIIRFVNKDEHIRSEYVLVGTMMSYTFAIVTGSVIKWLLKI